MVRVYVIPFEAVCDRNRQERQSHAFLLADSEPMALARLHTQLAGQGYRVVAISGPILAAPVGDWDAFVARQVGRFSADLPGRSTWTDA